MSETLIVDYGMAFWLGVQTAISPCPLATSIAAVAYVGRRVGSPVRVLLAGLLYAAGQMLTYVGLASLLLASVFSSSEVSLFLQAWIHRLLGPILIVAGLFLLGAVRVPFRMLAAGPGLAKWADTAGLFGALVLGALFALSFCPLSAAWFFGGLMPVALREGSVFALPAMYGLGAGLPVVGMGAVIAFATGGLAKTLDAVRRIERWTRRIAGVIFVAVGLIVGFREWLWPF